MYSNLNRRFLTQRGNRSLRPRCAASSIAINFSHHRGESPSSLLPLPAFALPVVGTTQTTSHFWLAIPPEALFDVDASSLNSSLTYVVLVLLPLILLSSVHSIDNTNDSRAFSNGSADCRSLSILLVDDSRVDRLYVSSLIQKQNHRCVIAQNGAEAIDRYREDRFDLVLMDCHMPVLDGYQAVRQIREIERVESDTAELPIIALTANVSEEDRDKCLQAGMNDYLRKPIDQTDLLRMFEKWTRSESTKSSADLSIPPSQFPAQAERSINASELLQRCLRNVDLASRLLTELQATASDRMESLQRSESQGDMQELAAAAHSLKGAAGILCAHALSAAAAQLEQAAKADKVTDLEPLIEQTTSQLSLCLNDIPRIRQQLKQETT